MAFAIGAFTNKGKEEIHPEVLEILDRLGYKLLEGRKCTIDLEGDIWEVAKLLYDNGLDVKINHWDDGDTGIEVDWHGFYRND